jgi:hypothetical protein
MTQMGDPPEAGEWSQPKQNIAGATSTTNGTKIWVGNRIVGEVRGVEFIKRVRGSKHFLCKPPAIAFDISSLEDARATGASVVRIIDDETGKTYPAPISTIFSKGFPVNRGQGEQIGLEFQYWQRDNDPLATQLGLWG